MLARVLLALASALLAAEASVLPNVHARADEELCQAGGGTTTVTVTGAPAPAQTEQYSSVGTVGGGNAPGVLLPTTAPEAISIPASSPSTAGDDPSDVAQSSQPTQTADSGTSSGNDTAGASSSGYKNVLYFTNWYVSSPVVSYPWLQLTLNRGIYGADYQPQQLPATQVTHVLYAFANIDSDGTV